MLFRSICSSCNFVHSNGAGQFYTDCANPLGTYTQSTALEAALAYGGSNTFATCATGEAAVISSKATGFGVWVYTGSLAGHVFVSTDPLAPFVCPSQSSQTWN